MSDFLHLHLHSDRSIFDGLITIGNLVQHAKQYGLKSIAITDHGNINAAIALWKACKTNGLKPIFGVEAYIVDDKTIKKRGYNHIILLAKNRVGFQNLITLCTIGNQYFYYKPRIDFSDIRKYGEGLIITTACLGGIAAAPYGEHGLKGLQAILDRWFPLFGHDFYFEVQPYTNESQRSFNEGCIAFAKENKEVKLVATGDCHYFLKEDRGLHDCFMKIHTSHGKKDTEGGDKYGYDGQYHVRNLAEMQEQFADLHGYDVTYVPCMKAAIDCPNEIDDKIELFDITKGVKIPSFKR